MKQVLFFLFCLSSLGAFAESPEDKLRAAIARCFISMDPTKTAEAEKVAPRFVERFFGGDQLVLTASEKSGISSGKLKVKGYQETLKELKTAAKVSPRVVGELPSYASKGDLTELDKLAVQKFFGVMQVQIRRIASSMSLNGAKMAAIKYLTFKEENGKAPVKSSDLELEEMSQFKSPVDGKLKAWILVGKENAFQVNGKDVVILAPEAIDGKFAAAFSDGSAKLVDEKEVPKALRSK